MNLADQKRSNSRATLHRDLSKHTLNRDASRTSFLNMETRHGDSQVESLTKEKEKLEKKVKELEISKIKVMLKLTFSLRKKTTRLLKKETI